MTTETRRRIRAYKKALPELRERVIAVALLLAMSVSMLTTASFAWLTISRRPEVTGVSTTVAANGNLEIALATSATEPDESQVGDSSAAEGQSVTAANITWGNLINLSDPSYGLGNLTLRPARLNTDALLTSPLFGAVFTADGRVEKLTSNFEYTSWIQPEKGNGYFGLSDQLGVRAISSTKLDATDSSYLRYLELQGDAESSNSNAVGAFDTIMANKTWMDLLAKVMGYHMCAYLEPGKADYYDKEITSAELEELMKMYKAFISAFEHEASAMATLMNFQLYALHGGDESKYTAYTANSILTSLGDPSGLKKNGTRSLSIPAGSGHAVITEIETFLYDYYMLCGDYAVLEETFAKQKDAYLWTTDKLKDVISNLVNIDKCLIQVGNDTPKTVADFLGGLTSDIFGATKYLNAECVATITNGVLYDFCKFTGAKMSVSKENSNGKKGLPITAGMYVDTFNMPMETTVYATIITNAPSGSVFAANLKAAKDIHFEVDSSQMTIMAQDTYALAIDLWVRTNADSSYLTLEGNILTQSHEEPLMGKNAAAEDVPLYTLTRTTEVTETDPETSETTTVTVTNTYELYPDKITQDAETGYYKAADDNAKWYRADTFTEFTLEDGETPTQQWEIITEVIGFEGENRIWDREENENLTVDSTSQGSGSCYVYYADTPEDMARSLELLKAMHVAFIDESGNLLASATMDTDNHYDDSGRVIVPLKLDVDSLDIGTEENPQRVITMLQKNVPTRITALVYLDGTMLTNENVLSAAEIQGQLNIQFGSSSNLAAIENEALELAERSVSASVNKTKFSYDTDPDLTATVSIAVSGEEPNNVTAFFIRKINDTQGSREPVMTNFVRNEATGTWDCDYTFTAPGTYILRTVQLDGQEYVLKTTPEVVVEGFTITSLDCSAPNLNNRRFTVMTADNSTSVDLTLRFASDNAQKMPGTVQGRFLRSDGTAVNVNFTYNANSGMWTGTANFLASGEYAFEYVVLDGEYTALPEGMALSANISLGMKVAVYNSLDPKEFKFLPAEMTDDQKLLKMTVRIMDGSGKEMAGLTDAWLYYNRSDSAINTMDTKLTWDAAEGLYYGELKTFEAADGENGETNVGAGVWKFNRVKVGSNTITNATTAPIFTLISPEPPKYMRINNKTNYTFAPGGDAKMEATIKNSSTSTVMALIQKDMKDSTGKVTSSTQYYVIAENSTTSGDETTWLFYLPSTEAQDGYWTMKELYIWNYYDDQNEWITTTLTKTDGNEWKFGDNGVSKWIRASELNLTDENTCMRVNVEHENYQMKVVETVNVTFPGNAGNISTTFEGTFLQTHTISGINVIIADFEGKPLDNVKNMTLTYDYDGKTQEYGFYTSSGVVAIGDGGAFTVDFVQDANDATLFVQKESETEKTTVQYAGNYTPNTFKFTVGANSTSKSYSGVDNAVVKTIPSYTVKSAKPTVKVTGVSPTGTFNVNSHASAASGGGFTQMSGVSNSFTDFYAAVYIEYTGAIDVGFAAWRYYAEPSVTLTLSGMPTTFENASITFDHPTADYAATYTFTPGDGLVQTKEIGHADEPQLTDANPNLYYAGKQTVDSIEVKYGELTLDVELYHEVTINQPQYPPYASFATTSTTGVALNTVPPNLVATTNSEGAFQITLPGVSAWTVNNVSRVDSEFAQSGDPVTTYGYTVQDGGCDDDTYTAYTLVTTTYTATSAETTWTTTHSITSWKIGNTVYAPGATVTITSNQTITAVVESTDSTKTTTTKTATKQYLDYTEGSSGLTSRPTGSNWSNVDRTDRETAVTYS